MVFACGSLRRRGTGEVSSVIVVILRDVFGSVITVLVFAVFPVFTLTNSSGSSLMTGFVFVKST